MEFCGSGDDGELNSIRVRRQDDAPGDGMIHAGKITGRVDFNMSSSDFDHNTNQWVRKWTGRIPTRLNVVLDHIGYALLEATDLDWVNNEGGQGEIEIDLECDPPLIHVSVGINRTEVDANEFNF